MRGKIHTEIIVLFWLINKFGNKDKSFISRCFYLERICLMILKKKFSQENLKLIFLSRELHKSDIIWENNFLEIKPMEFSKRKEILSWFSSFRNFANWFSGKKKMDQISNERVHNF